MHLSKKVKWSSAQRSFTSPLTDPFTLHGLLYGISHYKNTSTYWGMSIIADSWFWQLFNWRIVVQDGHWVVFQ